MPTPKKKKTRSTSSDSGHGGKKSSGSFRGQSKKPNQGKRATSVGHRPPQPPPQAPSDASILPMLNWMMYTSKYGDLIYDTVQLVFTCPTHKKVALSGVTDNCLYLPFYPVKHGQSWAQAVEQFIGEKLLRENLEKLRQEEFTGTFITEPILVELLRTQLPVYFDFVERATYQVQITPEGCKAKLCDDNGVIGWYRMGADFFTDLVNHELFGPEPFLIVEVATRESREKSINDIFAYQCLDELRDPSKLHKDDILRVYGDFLQHVSPSEYMVEGRFIEYLRKSNLPISSQLGSLFRAFAAKGQAYIDFEEFITGLLIISRLSGGEGGGNGELSIAGISFASLAQSSSAPTLLNGPPPILIQYSPTTMMAMAELVFRFYATSSTSTQLSGEQLARAIKDCGINLTTDVLMLKNAGGNKAAFIKLLTEKYLPKSNINTPNGQSGSMNIFDLVGDRSPMEHLHVQLAYPEIRRTETSCYRSNNAIQKKLQTQMLCENCHRKHYTLGSHHVKLDSTGLFYRPTLNPMENAKQVSNEHLEHEAYFFKESFVCNKILDIIRLFAKRAHIFPSEAMVAKNSRGGANFAASKRSSVSEELPDWSKRATKRSFATKIISLCEEVRELIFKAPRVIKVSSPCYVFGDIHGNLTDLLTYDFNIWRSNVYFCSSNLLFLGDYVDRGSYSVECILVLLCMKAIAPHRVHLLRGNHETRQLQREYTFFNEVIEKFGVEGQVGQQVFEAFNTVFDVMPLVAIVDESIYCAHGGIPSQATVGQIATIPSPLTAIADPSTANEILWNDPITDKEHADLLENDATISANTPNHPNGFPANSRRGTACYFSEFALRRFLTNNHLSHVIRAHECIPAGFWFHSGGKCLTIFSCSHYANGINDASIALIADSQILVIKVDTIAEQ